MLSPPASRASVYTAATAPWTEVELERLARRWLAPSERRRARAIVVPRARREFVLAKLLARLCAARALGVEPDAVAFEIDLRGKPRLPGGLGFSSTHTRGLVACALAPGCEVGIDAECVSDPGVEFAALERFYSSAERAAAAELDGSARRDHLFRCWTIKEAYAKARGLGLALGLSRVSCCFAADGSVDVRFDPALEDDARRWRFFVRRPSPDHLVAVALAFNAHAGTRQRE